VAPNVDSVTLRVDVTRGCLANPYTPPQDIDVLQYPAGSEPTYEVCTEPSSYQLLVVPSVIGLGRQAAISALHSAGFIIATVLAPSNQPSGTVIAQDPGGGSRLIQTGTVTITVAKGDPLPELATVPNVVGMQRGAAEEALAQAGFDAFVSFAEECVPDDQACDDRPGVVWSQSPVPGAERDRGSTVTILVNP
jgi:beta-lactam-binding protein with PASTA domain